MNAKPSDLIQPEILFSNRVNRTLVNRVTLTLLFSACALILGGDVDDAVCVDVEGDLNLRNTAGGGGDSDKGELTQHLVVCGHLSLALTHLDLHLSLAISCCGEHLERSRQRYFRTC